MRNCDRNAANSCEGLIHVDRVDFFALRRGSKQHGSRTASASNALLSRENRSSQFVNLNAECSKTFGLQLPSTLPKKNNNFCKAV